MDFRHRLASLLVLAGVACSAAPPQPGTGSRMVFSLGGRVAVVAVEATAAARRADRGTTAAAVGLIAALGRSDDNLGLVLFGEEAAALRTVTTMALKRARPPGVERDMDLPPLRGPASTSAALRKAQDLLERIEDTDESSVVWIGATSPDGELDLLAPTVDMFRGRGWRILVAPTADVGDGIVLDELAAGTRGAQFATDGGRALLRGVLDLAADMHVLFRRIDPTDEPVQAPEEARRLLFVALTGPGSDLLGARTDDKSGEPVWNPWVRRPADGEPPYRVAELSDPLALQTRTWTPQTVGTPSVQPFAELPLRIILSPGSPPVEVDAGAKVPVRMTVELAAGSHAVLAPRLTADAAFEGEAPTVLQPETSAEGSLTFSGLVACPTSGGPRPALTLRLQLEDPKAGTWAWTRRLQVRAKAAGEPPVAIDPPELDLGPSWEDEPAPPVPVTMRAREPITVEPEPSEVVEVIPTKLAIGADRAGEFKIAVARGHTPGPYESQVAFRIQSATGRALAGQFFRVTGSVVRWGAPAPVAFAPRKPGESTTLTIPAVWAPVPAGATVAGHLEGPDGARVELTCFTEADGGLTVAAVVPDNAPAGRYVGAISCEAPGLSARTIPASLDVGDGPLPPMPPPTLAAVEPATGPLAGTNAVTLRGTGFVEPVQVAIGGRPATVTTFGATALVISAPAAPEPGDVDVVVTNPDGQSALLMQAYRYDDAAVVPTTPVIAAEPPALALAGPAGTEVTAEVTLTNATPDRLPAHAELTDLQAADGSDLISARFDCAAEVVAPADGQPARIRYRVRLPADLASGRYTGTMSLRDPTTGDTVDVRVEVDVP